MRRLSVASLVAGLQQIRREISECPHPTKVVFTTRKKARRRAKQLGMTEYRCVCGNYHLSSQVGADVYEPCCPICGAPFDEYWSCGCYEEIHYGKD